MFRFGAVLAMAVWAALPLRAGPVSDAVQGVISDQISAFLVDDIDRAFSFASPGLRDHFGMAGRFGEMVKNGYPMVWRPGDVRFLQLDGDGKARRQIVEISDRAGRPFRLEYEMIETEEGWRIDAVRFLPVPPPMT
ncbi:hypothetical protein RGUI_4025 [Rhodovulum sp. P5]|uniref:DUF4864 domain-containing protein n=1 Tax=Rhodovulum sp. P5 TaxID=1564506 RepID=UPI0009C27035|nr:DUF4864 domain-containing protein [Rhodovulum sp. P5]ARE42166.1 hypothetical protein RGUI_4025 [Rhodovulum sp. P5]